jgi:protocatechuate 3,4-dioxygenase beta subunit
MSREYSRRRFLAAAAALGLTLRARDLAAQELSVTPECKHGAESTARQTEGPYFKPRSPERSDLREPGMAGIPIVLSGFVLTRQCQPVAGALVDLWQADDKGAYDNAGFRLRGHQFTDAQGRYRFSTIVPGHYPGRTRHFHVKVHAPGASALTTQLYFPDESGNRRDGLFRRELVMRVAKTGDGLTGRFDFILDLR